MSKVGKAYKRTDELTKKTRASLPSGSLMAVYDTAQHEEFSVEESEFATANPTDGRIPEKESDGTFIDSPMTVIRDGGGNPTNVVFDVEATIPSGTLNVGGILDRFTGELLRGVTSLKDSGESFLVSDNVTGKIYTVPRTIINDDLSATVGIGNTCAQEGAPFDWSIFGGTDDLEVTVQGNDRIIIEFEEVETAYITAQRFRGTQGKMHYRVIDTSTFDGEDTLIYTSEQGEPVDFDSATAPNFQVEYITKNPNYLIKDHILRLEFFSADGNPMTMKGQMITPLATGCMSMPGVPCPLFSSGDVTYFLPFFETKFSETEEKDLATQDWVGSNYAEEAPDDGIMYSRKSKAWVKDNALDTSYSNVGSDILATNVEGALNELSFYQRGVVCFQDNSTETIISSPSTPVKIAGTFMASGNNRGFSLGSNSLVYDGLADRVYDINVILDMTKLTGGGGVDTYEVWIYLNGSPTACGSIVSAAETNDTMVSTVMADELLTAGDIIEVYIENLTGTADVLVSDMRVTAR